MKTPIFIDINADLGEGSGNDADLMPLISSCNIACGGHYGNATSMRRAVKLAKMHDVRPGAHPSFPDKDNFGRKVQIVTKSELKEAVRTQILDFLEVCISEGVAMHHVKLHGALYNYAAIDASTADAVVEGILATNTRPKLYLPYHSILAKKAENLLPLVYEAFIDRRYQNDLSLVSRTEEYAVIESSEKAWQQLYEMINYKTVTTIENKKIPITAETFCIHGDHENAFKILKYIHLKIRDKNIQLIK